MLEAKDIPRMRAVLFILSVVIYLSAYWRDDLAEEILSNNIITHSFSLIKFLNIYSSCIFVLFAAYCSIKFMLESLEALTSISSAILLCNLINSFSFS